MAVSRRSYLFAAFLALALLAWFFFPTAASLNTRWYTRGEAYSHGYLIVAISLFLIARRWPALKAAPLAPTTWPLPALLGLSLLWLAGHVTSALIVQQAILPLLVLLTATTLFGNRVGRLVRFPILLIYAVIPFWDVLNPTLQVMTVKVCTFAVKLLGIPVYIQYTRLTIPEGTIEVAGGCSGLNYLLMSATLAAIYGHLYYRRTSHKITLVAVGAVLGLLSNWLRVFCIIIIGHLSDMQNYLVRHHESLGWVVFALCLVPLFTVARRLEDREAGLAEPVRAPEPATPMSGSRAALPAALVLFACAGPLWLLMQGAPEGNGNLAAAFAANVSPPLMRQPNPAWTPDFHNADVQASFTTAGTPPLNVSLTVYYSQRQRRELISWDNRIVDPTFWQIRRQSSVQVAGLGTVGVLQVQPTNSRAVSEIIYWYAIGAHATISDIEGKWHQMLAFLRGRSDAALIAIRFRCRTDCSDGHVKALDLAPQLQKAYDQAMATAVRNPPARGD